MNTIGVLGGRWRASVSASGTVLPWDGTEDLQWFIAADDRWHVPVDEPTVRQRRLDGAPVIETRMKVPNGDAVHRVWCVADAEGLTVVEIENASSLPFAVAFNRADILSSRPPAMVPIQGIDLPAGSVVFPIGHHTTVRFGLPHVADSSIEMPERISSAMQVARGWTTIVDGAGRLVVPDESMMETVARLRTELALGGPPLPSEDPVGFLIGVGQLVRLGEQADAWVIETADAVAKVARLDAAWDVVAALDAAALVLARAGEKRALRDLGRLRAAGSPELPVSPPDQQSGRLLAWYESGLARCAGPGAADLLGTGIPVSWRGSNFEVYGLPVGAATTVSFAVRWHGERPAVLWETEGPAVLLTANAVAPGWSSSLSKGEALWPAPDAGAHSVSGPIDPAESADISFN